MNIFKLFYSLYVSVGLQNRYMGYHWLYREEEYAAGLWLYSRSNSLTAAGNMKASYLIQGYFAIHTNAAQGYQYLSGKSQLKPEVLYIYLQMFKNGYVLGYHGVDLPQTWTENANHLNLIYFNGQAALYAQ